MIVFLDDSMRDWVEGTHTWLTLHSFSLMPASFTPIFDGSPAGKTTLAPDPVARGVEIYRTLQKRRDNESRNGQVLMMTNRISSIARMPGFKTDDGRLGLTPSEKGYCRVARNPGSRRKTFQMRNAFDIPASKAESRLFPRCLMMRGRTPANRRCHSSCSLFHDSAEDRSGSLSENYERSCY